MLPTKESMMYDMIKDQGKDIKLLLSKHDECAKQIDLDSLKKVVNTSRGLFLGVGVSATIIVTVVNIYLSL